MRSRFQRLLPGAVWFLLLVAFVALPECARAAPAKSGRDSAREPEPSPTHTRAFPGLDSLAGATLGRALDYLEIQPSELGFDKLYADDDTFRLGLVEEILADPLRIPDWQAKTLERLRQSIERPADLAALLGELDEAAPAERAYSGTPVATAASADEAIAAFLQRCKATKATLDQAFARLTAEDRRRVLMLAPAFWGDWENGLDKEGKGALHRELGVSVDTTFKLTEDPILDAAILVNRPLLTQATEEYIGSLEILARDLGAGTAAFAAPAPETATLAGVSGTLRRVSETPWGLLVIGGAGANTYSAEALEKIAFLIEPAGDDVYRGRAASAVGDLLRPLGAVIDGAGNDLYEADGRAFCLGGAVLGLAALLDFSGDDVYRAGDGSSGAGFFGSGFLIDGGGVDLFEGRNLSEGAGAVGIGALLSRSSAVAPPGPELEEDRSFTLGFVKVPGTGAVPIRYDENDTYTAARYSQGFASTFGVGLLYDATGNDLYRAGGHYLHRPLLPDDFQSLSQGFSIGFRPRAGGGIGILMDEQGNDFYDAEVYSQGASYWYSLGLLFDGAGNDRYLATQYSQGAGIHLSIGSIWDRGGDDHYVCKLGVTQGTAHDLSVGFQLDESGNDYYVVSDGQGISITNSAAIFIDEQGNDVYATPGVGQGSLTWARGFCGAGIFLDLEGKDTYREGSPAANGAVWSPDLFSIGIDLDRDVILPAEVVPEPVLTAADSARAVPELFDTASLWEVGSARATVRRARAALLTKPAAAMEYAIHEKLNSQDGLVYRTLVEVAKAQPDSFSARVLPRLRDPDQYVQRNVISLLGELKRKEARPVMEGMLRDRGQERHWPRLIQALGLIGDPAASPALRPFLRDAKERRRIAAASALGTLKDTLSVPTLVDLLEDPYLTVRSAASSSLVSFRTAAVPPLAARNGGGMIALRTLGQIAAGIPDTSGANGLPARAAARQILMNVLERGVGPQSVAQPGQLSGAQPGERGAAERAAAVRALLVLGDPETVDFVRLHMKDEYDPLVLRAFETGLQGIAKREK